MSFAPEAQRKLAGGGAERNRRKRVEIYSQPRRGDRPASVCRPSGAGGWVRGPGGSTVGLSPAYLPDGEQSRTCLETLSRPFAVPLPAAFFGGLPLIRNKQWGSFGERRISPSQTWDDRLRSMSKPWAFDVNTR